MREIKFRAWDKKNKRMINPETCNKFIGKEMEFYPIVFKVSDITHGHDLELMQYTGFKDKKGNKIYEEDIVLQEIWNGEDGIEQQSITDEFKGIVVFDINGWGIQTNICKKGESEVSIFPCDSFINTEIIGNIYENPKLLKI